MKTNLKFMEKLMDSQNFIRAIIDRFEGKIAVIRTEDSQEIHWPIKNLPDECKEGSALRIILATSESDQIEREKLAKTILNQLLKKDNNGESIK